MTTSGHRNAADDGLLAPVSSSVDGTERIPAASQLSMDLSGEAGCVVVKPPPALPKAALSNPVARLLPLAMLVAAVGMMVVYFNSGTAANRTPMFMFFPVMMVMSVLGTMLYGARGGADRSAEIDRNRRSYLRYLDCLDDAIVATAIDQRRQQYSRHPAPGSLWALAGSRRTGQPGPGDPDFGCVRVGVGQQSLCTPLLEPDLGAAEDRDPVTVSAVRALIMQRSAVGQSPIVVPLRQHSLISVQGDVEHARGLVRAMVCQLSTHHGPDRMAIEAITDHKTSCEWEWLKWLPHYEHSLTSSGQYMNRHAVVVIDRTTADAGNSAVRSGVTTIEIGTGSAESALCLCVDAEHMTVRSADRREADCRPDSLSMAQAVACARQLAARGSEAAGGGRRLSTARGWLDLMGIEQPDQLIPEKLWARDDGHQVRPVPIGVADDGTPVRIDINEAARNGIGPHGLCVGATGSGKSELLRTLVLGLITTHPPDVLNLVLVDFKGGATFLGNKSQELRAKIYACVQRSTPASATTRPAEVSVSHGN